MLPDHRGTKHKLIFPIAKTVGLLDCLLFKNLQGASKCNKVNGGLLPGQPALEEHGITGSLQISFREEG